MKLKKLKQYLEKKLENWKEDKKFAQEQIEKYAEILNELCLIEELTK